MIDPDRKIVEPGLELRWEDTPIGYRFRTFGRMVRYADIINFISVTGTTAVLYTNRERLRTASLFSKRFAPEALVYSFAEGLLMQSGLQGAGLALLGVDMRVEKSTISGDTIHVVGEVIMSKAAGQPGTGIVKTRNQVVNQHGEAVMVYTPTRLIKGRDYVALSHQE